MSSSQAFNKKVVFVTGTRADYGKIKPLIRALHATRVSTSIFVCGMHLDVTHGSTYLAVMRDFPEITHIYDNLTRGKDASSALSECIFGFNRYICDYSPDLVIVHGDRVEALAACMSACLNNVHVAHIEGGEQSGTIDESIRHSISKFSHHHFVCNEAAKRTLHRLGEDPAHVYNIGSPDVDYIINKDFPSIEASLSKYNILFDEYGVVMYHPVTTDIEKSLHDCNVLADALIESDRKYVVILPNNDLGSKQIIEIYKSKLSNESFRMLPSIDFEYFISILANSCFLIGNSSAGIREMPYLNLPSLNIGLRQQSRLNKPVDSIINLQTPTSSKILDLLHQHWGKRYENKFDSFGDGNSVHSFIDVLTSNEFWNVPLQKELCF